MLPRVKTANDKDDKQCSSIAIDSTRWSRPIETKLIVKLTEKKQIYRNRYEKPPLAVRCCHVANDLTHLTDDRLTNEQTNRWTPSLRKATAFATGCFNGHVNTAEQRVIIQQYGNWYTGRWWVGCYIWYSEEGPAGCGHAQSPPRCSKCNSPSINGQCTNFILCHRAL